MRKTVPLRWIAVVFMIVLELVRYASCKKSRCLLVSVDNRAFNPDVHSNHYPTMTALLNREYAIHHGYDYLQLIHNIDDLEKQVHQKYTKFDIIPPTDNAKDAASAFHVGLHQFRAASWAKLPPLWDITRKFGNKYDLIFYIDSDAVISPLHFNRSLDDLLAHWQSVNKDTPPIKGHKDITRATFMFFNNFPWRDDMPCAGTFIYRPTALAEQILRQWWDFSGIPDRNFKHFHEQDALWHMIDGNPASSTLYLMQSAYTILGELQFPSSWTRYENLWLVHIASYNYVLRNPILNIFLKSLELHDPVVYSLKVASIPKVNMSTLSICEEMESVSIQDKSRLPLDSYPMYHIANESQWWDSHVSSASVPKLAFGVLMEGRLVGRKGEFWLVINGTRRGFTSFIDFQKLGLEADMAIHLTLGEVRSLPEGEKIGGIGGQVAAAKMLGMGRGKRRRRAAGKPENIDMR